MEIIAETDISHIAKVQPFGEGEDASEQEQLEAWAYLIKTGLCWRLQGWYGRQATQYINGGIISKDGKIL